MYIKLLLAISLMGWTIQASDKEEKRITIVRAKANTSHKDSIKSRLLEECIESFPQRLQLNPIVTKTPVYLKEINGVKGENGFRNTYTAKIEISYKIKQKELLVIPSSQIVDGEPQLKVLDKSLMGKKMFESQSENGDMFAGRSKRRFYFSSETLALDDVILQAQNWIKSQNAVECK